MAIILRLTDFQRLKVFLPRLEFNELKILFRSTVIVLFKQTDSISNLKNKLANVTFIEKKNANKFPNALTVPMTAHVIFVSVSLLISHVSDFT